MAQGIDSTKTPARPSHEAVETDTSATEVGESARRRLDQVAMEAAKRPNNRIHTSEETTPGDTVFSK